MIVEIYKTVVPLVGYKRKDPTPILLGTGFFVENSPVPFLVTANHNIEDWVVHTSIMVPPDLSTYQAEIIAQDEDVDLALLHVPKYQPEKALQIAQDSELVVNQVVNCYEYSELIIPKEIECETADPTSCCRLGNIVSIADMRTTFGLKGEDMLVLSFAALKGSSGAPVLSNRSFRLWGIVANNMERELLPPHLETVYHEKNQTSKVVKYGLYQAVAIHVKHLRRILKQHSNP
jgi:hypothetical protein